MHVVKQRVYKNTKYSNDKTRAISRAWSARNPGRSQAQKYGVTVEYLKELRKQQGNHCLICLCEFHAESRKATSAVVDHCHITKKIRGFLCQNCNVGIGVFHENEEKMQRAINYVRDWKARVNLG